MNSGFLKAPSVVVCSVCSHKKLEDIEEAATTRRFFTFMITTKEKTWKIYLDKAIESIWNNPNLLVSQANYTPPSFVTVHLPRLPGDEILYQQEPDAVRADTEATSDFDILAVTQEARRHFALATYTRILKGDVNLIDRRVANANVIGMETLIMVQKAMHHRLRLYAV